MSQFIEWEKPNGIFVKTNTLEATLEKCIELGWDRVKPKGNGSIAINGDEGSGRPGDDQWHKTSINSMKTKKEVFDYLASSELKIDGRGSLDKIKEKALIALGVD